MTDTDKYKRNMNLPACSPENSILEGDLELAVLQKTIDQLQIMETQVGFYVVVLLRWAEGKQWYLTTRRDRHTPKIFKDLKRLNNHLKEMYSTDSFVLFRNMKLPPHPKKVVPPKSGNLQKIKAANTTKKGNKQ